MTSKVDVKTMKISELIGLLTAYKNKFGDIPVIHQADPEGNSYGTINPRSINYGETKIGKAVFIFPFEEDIEDKLFDSIF